jgi:subfamily B ATP-binding cassette protein MsbA
MHLGYFNNQRKGVLISKITADVQVIQGSITNTLIVFFKEPITLVLYFGFLFYLNFKLTLFTILVVPISGLIISMISKNLRKSSNQAQSVFGIMLSFLDEALSGIKIIKSFNAESYIQNKFHKENITYTDILRKIARRQELSSPISEFLGLAVVVGVVIYGGYLITHDQTLSAATFVGYIIILSQAISPVKSISNSFSLIQHGISSGERVLKIMDEKNLVANKPDAIRINDFEKEIEFKNVSFSYENKGILKNISFKIPKGKSIALVGPSGAGKSTISDLIPRFYDPQEGGIYLDGLNLKDYHTDSIRALMGIVSQESILFNDTIFNNIAFGKPNASKEEVIQAAKVANAHNFIIETESSYETIIGDRGVKLSGGQKQRLSIARAVLKNPPILLLDEATSALDTESEKLVQEALSNLMKNRTSLVIAHRLSTIQNADEILVIQNGEIVERGRHGELITNAEGLYNKLKTLQAS